MQTLLNHVNICKQLINSVNVTQTNKNSSVKMLAMVLMVQKLDPLKHFSIHVKLNNRSVSFTLHVYSSENCCGSKGHPFSGLLPGIRYNEINSSVKTSVQPH